MKTLILATHSPPAEKFFATTGRQTNSDQTVAGAMTSRSAKA